GALANVTSSPLADSLKIPRNAAFLDILTDYPIGSATSQFSMTSTFALMSGKTLSVVRFKLDGRPERAYEYYGDPGVVHFDPRWLEAGWAFIKRGIAHILDGIDHLLFIFALVIPARRVRPLLPIIPSFTVAHSITLIGSAAGLAPTFGWFPPLI